MKPMLQRLLCLFFVFQSFYLAGSAQTSNIYTIDYSTLKGNMNCNLFASPTKVSNYYHTTSVGFPYEYGYTTTVSWNVLALDCNYDQYGTSYGTAVNIQFPWKPYHSYAVDAYATGLAAADGVSTIGDLNLWMGVNNGGAATNPSTNCSGAQPFTPLQMYASLNYGLTSSNTSIYPSNQLNFVCPAQLQTFLVAGYGIGGAGSVLVQKIVIYESKDFTLSPATATITCGSFVPITFSVANPGQVTVTNYVWNLGAGNTWLYNGTAAPASITTTTPNITLTPAPGTTTPTNVSVNVNANGGVYNTLVSTISYNSALPTNIAITGNTTIATINPSTNAYSLNNLPASASVVWSASPSGLVNLSTSGNTVSLSPVSEASGTVTLTAVVTLPCGTTGTYTLPIALQNACNLITTPVSLSATYNSGGYLTLNWNSQPGITGYNVQYTPNGLSSPIQTAQTTTNSYNWYGPATGPERFSVQAYCNSGQASNYSKWDTFTVTQPCAEAVISNVSALGNQVIVTMSPVSGITGYNINLTNQSTGATSSMQNVLNSSDQYIFTGNYSTTYSVTAQTVCSPGVYTLWTQPVTATTQAPGSCTPPSIQDIEVSQNKIYIFWTKTSDASSYNFQFTNTATGVSTIVQNIPYASDYVYTASPNVTYQVAVQSNCTAGGQSSWTIFSSYPITTTDMAGTAMAGQATVFGADSLQSAGPSLYPVPAFGPVTLLVPSDKDRKIYVQVYSMSGSLVYANTMAATKGTNTFTLNLGGLVNGIYTVKVIEGKERAYVRKLIIQK